MQPQFEPIGNATIEHGHEFGEIVRQARTETYPGLGLDQINSMHTKVGGYDKFFESEIVTSWKATQVSLGKTLAAICLLNQLPNQIATNELSYLYVDSAMRGKGLGASLLDDAIETSVINGAKELRISVFEYNKPAITLYESRGAKRVGTIWRPYYSKLGMGFRLSIDLTKDDL